MNGTRIASHSTETYESVTVETTWIARKMMITNDNQRCSPEILASVRYLVRHCADTAIPSSTTTVNSTSDINPPTRSASQSGCTSGCLGSGVRFRGG